MRLKKVFAVRLAAWVCLSAALLCGAALHEGAAARVAVARASQLQGGSTRQPTVERIAFAAAREIYLINRDGTGLTQLTQSDPGVTNYQPALSPDGARVAFGTSRPGNSGIVVLDIEGGLRRNLTSNTVSLDGEPAWSPDGTRIAFVRGYDPTVGGVANFTTCGANIYVANVDGPTDEIVNLTPGWADATDPSWSPGGERLAFAATGVDNYDIYSLHLPSGVFSQLTNTSVHEAEPAWSPDGKRIAYARGYVTGHLDCGFAHTGLNNYPTVSGPDIYIMSEDGSSHSRLTYSGDNIEPAWSPDADAVALISFRSGPPQVYIVSLLHRNDVRLTADPAPKSSPSWARAVPLFVGGPR
jgi:TolB protein